MPFTPSRRLAAAGCAVAAGVGALVAAAATPAGAATPMTVSSINVHRLPAKTDKQQLTVTGTNFAESSITTVSVAGCTSVSYFVTSATTLLVKTDATCNVGTNVVITIQPVSGSNVVTTPSTVAAEALTFVDAPSLAANDATTFPVVTAGTALQTAPKTSASSAGGTAIRVTAGSVAFINSTAYPLSATVDGAKLTGVVMHTGGDYFTGTLPALAANDAPVLAITSNGVSKSFNYAAADSTTPVADSFEFRISGVSITVSPASGPVDGGNLLTIKGTGFTAATTATVNSVNCPKTGTTTATQFTCTIAKASTEGPVTVQTTTGSVTSVISLGSTYTFVR